MKIFVYSLRKNLITIILGLFAICLVIFSNSNLLAAKNGLILWATAVVPSLFPFFVATELLSYTNIVSILGKYLKFIMKPLFGVPGEASFAFIMGLISGYPVGAKIVCKLYADGKCTKEEAERMLAFTNNSGPLFIIGTVGITLFANTTIGILLFVTHVLSCISVGILLNIKHALQNGKLLYTPVKSSLISSPAKVKQTVTFSSLGEILGKSITSSISTILLIGGFVVIFSVIISILNQSHLLDSASTLLKPITALINLPSELVSPILSGMVELTNGVNLVANVPLKSISINIIVCAFLLGFGGISILLQVFSIISKNGLSIKTYFFRKIVARRFCCSLYTNCIKRFSVFTI